MKLRYKLNLLVIGMIILSISVPSLIYYYYSKGMLKQQADSYLQLELTKNVYDINSWFDTQSQAVIIIRDIIQNSYEKKDITKDLLQGFISNKNIADIYIGFNDGSFLSGIGWIPDLGYDPRLRPWYQEAMEAGKLNISNVYFDLTSNQSAVAIGVPLKDKNQNEIGVLSEDILLNTIYEKINNIQLNDSGYAILLDSDGNVVIHPDASLIGKNYDDIIQNKVGFDLDVSTSGEGRYRFNGVNKIVVYKEIVNTNWVLVLVMDENKVYAPLYQLVWIFLIIVIVTSLMAAFLAGLFNRNITQKLSMISNASIALSKGMFDTEIADLGKDEIGDVAKAFNRMKTELKEIIEELNASRGKYEELIENTADAIYSVDVNGYIITANTVFLKMFQIERDSVEQKNLATFIKNSELGVILILLGAEVIEKKQLISRKIDNIEDRFYNVTLSPIWDKEHQEIKGVTTILHDTSDSVVYSNHLEWISHHDALTQLPNRFKLMEDMDSVFLKAENNKLSFAILLLDLDDFKNINDILGYSAGDIVLLKVAELLSQDHVCYRIGADEFALIIDYFESIPQLEQITYDISGMLNQSFEIALNTVYNSATIGVAIYPNDFTDANEMMTKANAALNYAKINKRSGVQFYDYSISQTLEDQL